MSLNRLTLPDRLHCWSALPIVPDERFAAFALFKSAAVV